ncbi:MAG: AAA family ATPase [Gammaproteobacteria bacterium]|nr:AAA family ATPase [Gammaproteobacteria bacterium]
MTRRQQPELHLSVLGDMECAFSGELLPRPQRLPRRLMAYLCLEAGRHSRAALAKLFYPNRREEDGRALVRQALFQLSKIGARYGSPIKTTRDFVEISDNYPIITDYEKFLSADIQDVAEIRRAIALHRGPFLSTDEGGSHGEWRQWVLRRRKIIDDRLAAYLERLIQAAEDARDFEGALRWAEEWRRKQPAVDGPVKAIMKILAHDGRSSEALHVFAVHQETLATRYGAKPGADIRNIRERLLSAPTGDLLSGKPVPFLLGIPTYRTFVTVLAIVPNADTDQITDPLIESHIHHWLDLAQQVALACGGGVQVASDGTIEMFFGLDVAVDDGPRRALHAAFELRRISPSGSSAGMGIHSSRVMINSERRPIGPLLQTVRAAARANSQGTGVVLSAMLLTNHVPAVPTDSLTTLTAINVHGNEIILYLLTEKPSLFVSDSENNLVGRDKELAQIIFSAEQVVSEKKGRAIWVVGQAGIGKTHLIRHVKNNLPHGVAFIHCRCLSIYQQSFMFPLASLMMELIGLDGLDKEQSRMTLLQFLGDVGEADQLIHSLWLEWLNLGEDDSYRYLKDYRQILFESVLHLITNRIFVGPRVFLIEDIHWADSGTLEFLTYYLSDIHNHPTLVISTSRNNLPYLYGVAFHEETLNLEKFDAGAARLFLHTLPGWTENPDNEDLIIRRCDGIPIYIEYLARDIMSGGSVHAIPDNIYSMLDVTISKAVDFIDILQVCAILGEPVSLSFLKDLFPRYSLDDLNHIAHRLENQGIWIRSGDAWDFRHELLRDAVYSGIPQQRRQMLHSYIARELAGDEHYDPSVIAKHFGMAGDIT